MPYLQVILSRVVEIYLEIVLAEKIHVRMVDRRGNRREDGVDHTRNPTVVVEYVSHIFLGHLPDLFIRELDLGDQILVLLRGELLTVLAGGTLRTEFHGKEPVLRSLRIFHVRRIERLHDSILAHGNGHLVPAGDKPESKPSGQWCSSQDDKGDVAAIVPPGKPHGRRGQGDVHGHTNRPYRR